MMYYPSSTNNLLKRGAIATNNNNIHANFENIYQPFGNNVDQGMLMQQQQQQQIAYNDFSLNDQQLLAATMNNSDVDGNCNYVEMIIDLFRQESGFGFRIVGGEEEGSQVAVGYIVHGGSAHLDGRLRPNDEIIMIDNECVLGATHRRVVQLMTIAGLNRKVKLMIRRKCPVANINSQANCLTNNNNNNNNVNKNGMTVESTTINQLQRNSTNNSSSRMRQLSVNANNTQQYPYTITLFRSGNEGFGFVIISTLNKSGPSIGKIVENSPAERCKRLNIGDRIIAVNNINITQMNHIEIVKLIKESGNSIMLTIGQPYSGSNCTPPIQSQACVVDTTDSNTFINGNTVNRQFASPQQTTVSLLVIFS
jgi:atrophin-1 interacting protein 3 (BAI1-associated protein 1)